MSRGKDCNPTNAKIKVLEAEQQSLFKIAQKCFDLSKEAHKSSKDSRQFLISIQSLENVKLQFKDITERLNIEKCNEITEYKPNFSMLESFEDMFCEIKYVEREICGEFSASSKSEKLETSSSKSDVMKLPKLELASFSGDPALWSVFYQNFKSIIHDNKSLTDTQKVQYLLPKLSGKALSICSGIPATGENYQIIWKTLVQRFEDKRYLSSHYMEQMMQFKPVTSATPAALEAFCDKFCTAVAALKSVEIPNLADFLITHIALSKLDKETVFFFEQYFRDSKDEVPTFERLEQFIHEQSKILARSNNTVNKFNSTSTSKKNPPPTSKLISFIVNDNHAVSNMNNNCVVCNSERHPLFKCKVFMNSSPFERRQIVNRNRFCWNCLGFHGINYCKSNSSCNICNRKHHTLLCYSYPNNNQIPHSPRTSDRSVDERHPNHRSRNVTLTPAAYVSHTSGARAPPPLPPPPAPQAHYAGPPPAAAPLPRSPVHISRSPSTSFARAPDSNSNVAHLHKCNQSIDVDSARLNNNPMSLLTSNFSQQNSNLVRVLPTARVIVYDSMNRPHSIRVLLDSCSMGNFITESCCRRLGVNIMPASSSVKGIGSSVRPTKGRANFIFHSRFDKLLTYSVHAFVIDKITDDLPAVLLDTNNFSHLNGLPMADDTFNIPGPIDGIIGTEIFPYLLGSKRVASLKSHCVGIETTLGYVCMGSDYVAPQPSHTSNDTSSFFCSVLDVEDSLDARVKNFWEIENISLPPQLSTDEKECQKIFLNTFTRNDNGRYTVMLPFKEDPAQLGDSANIALKRFSYLEKKFEKYPQMRFQYNATIQDYIDKGYLSRVENPDFSENSYYIPHHAVFRPEKTTSQTRIVLDASCKTSSGKSLNDLLHCGPNLQNNIFDILINFRLFPVVLLSDIEKMYFQIILHENHRKFQRIFFRFDSNEPISTYEFNRLSFGTKASPYLALRVVQQLIEDEKEHYPLAASYLNRSMYMDDYINSFPTVELAKEVYSQLVQLFASGGFNLTKWVSNSPEILERIPTSCNDSTPRTVNFQETDSKTVVGIRWTPLDDFFSFEVQQYDSSVCTKRTLLSYASKYYDPIGLIGPVVAFMKLLVQECWKAGLKWDEPAPPHIVTAWNKIASQMSHIKNIKIPRHIGISNDTYVILLGFSDASEKCYGAAVYIRVSSNKDSPGKTSLLCSKSKLAPLKKLTLARLELCAAYLLSKLIVVVKDIISARCKIHNILAMSDSTVALSWIHSESHKWQTFIGNRVALIQSNLDQSHWFHIAGVDNPSDILSRPTTPAKLVDNDLWFKGPAWCNLPISEWPLSKFSPRNLDSMPEAKAIPITLATVTLPEEDHVFYSLASKVSNFRRLIRVVVYVLRFTRKLRSRGPVTVNDLETAEFEVIKVVQNNHFKRDIALLKANKECSPQLRKLCPFIERDLLRVGGRLKNSQLSYGQKHPLILPAKDPIVEKIIVDCHENNLHTGPSLVSTLLRQHYWILNSRKLIRKLIHSCNTCFRTKPRPLCPLMGQEPSYRVTPQTKCFVETGVDYAGPLYVTTSKRRGVKSQKAYICIFICLATKAIHIELVSDLSTEMFLNAFKRFISRRGPVSVIHSDRGTNFICAKRKIDELYSLVSSANFNDSLTRELIDNKITFRFNPPYSPHMGGIWETAVRSVKLHLFRVIGTQILTYEEMNTVLIQIEALLNSRPLCVLPSSDPSEPLALTPAHFLCSTPLKWIPSQDLSNQSPNRLERYQLMDKLVQSYWLRWRFDYLNSLLPRQKWTRSSTSIKEGTVVVLKEDNSPPLHWPLGLVEKTYPGPDGIVRVVDVRTRTGTHRRPVVRICPLPTQ